MNKNFFFKSILVFCFFSVFLFISSCGTNLFTALVPHTTENELQDITSKLDNATTAEDYQAIIDQAKAIADDANASDSDKQEAQALLGEAYLGKAGFTIIDFADSLASLDSTSNASESFFDIFYKEDTDSTGKTNLKAGADAMNAADALNSTAGSLTNDQQVMRGMANAMAAVNLLSDSMDISSGTVERENDTSAKSTLSELSSNGTLTYAAAAVDAIGSVKNEDGSSALSEDHLEQANTLGKLSELNTAINGTGSYTYSDDNGNNIEITSASTEEQQNVALDYLLRNF